MTAQAPSFHIVDYLIGLPDATLNAFVDQDATFGRMVFRNGLPFRVAGTQKRAIVATDAPGAGLGQTRAYSSSVSLRLYADHTRDSNGVPVIEDGEDKAWAMFGLLDQILNTNPTIRRLPAYVQCNRTSQPLPTFDPDQDLPYLAVIYDVAVLAAA